MVVAGGVVEVFAIDLSIVRFKGFPQHSQLLPPILDGDGPSAELSDPKKIRTLVLVDVDLNGGTST